MAPVSFRPPKNESDARPIGFVAPAEGTASASEWTDSLKKAVGSEKGRSIFLFPNDPEDADHWKSQLTGEGLAVFSTSDLFAHTPAARKPDVEAATALFFLSRCEKIVSLPDSLRARLASAIGGAEWMPTGAALEGSGGLPS